MTNTTNNAAANNTDPKRASYRKFADAFAIDLRAEIQRHDAKTPVRIVEARINVTVDTITVRGAYGVREFTVDLTPDTLDASVLVVWGEGDSRDDEGIPMTPGAVATVIMF